MPKKEVAKKGGQASRRGKQSKKSNHKDEGLTEKVGSMVEKINPLD